MLEGPGTDNHLFDDEIERYLDEHALASDQERVHGHMAACPSCFATWREIITAHETLLGGLSDAPGHVDDDEPLEQMGSSTAREESRSRDMMLRGAALLLAGSLGVAIARAFAVGDLGK